MWASAHEEPPASVTITWAIDVNDTTIIDLAGDICTEAVQRIRRLFSDVADTSAGNVAIDASDVTFIGSRGLSLLLGTQRRLAERGLRCRVVGPLSAMRPRARSRPGRRSPVQRLQPRLATICVTAFTTSIGWSFANTDTAAGLTIAHASAVEPRARIELATYALRMRCSTD